MSRTPTLRLAALLLAATAGVHELRYLLAFGTHAPGALAHHGHGYLAVVMPGLAFLLALALAQLVLRAARGGDRTGRSRSPWRTWPPLAAALLAAFAVAGVVLVRRIERRIVDDEPNT